MIILFVFGLLILVTTTVIMHILSDGDIRVLFTLIMFAIGEFFSIMSLNEHYNNNNPSALDVYQDKTTLEIKYKDGVPIDSVVVFKEK